MYDLPTKINIDGKTFSIRNNGDYRVILDCFQALQDEELTDNYKIFTALIIFYEDFDDLKDINKHSEIVEQLVREMFNFINCGQDGPPGGIDRGVKVIDWKDDFQIISAAINAVAKQEIRALSYLHWWTFMGYFMSIGQSVLSTVVSIREKIAKGKKLDEWEKDFRKSNPQYFKRKLSKEDKSLESLVRDLWENGGDLNGQ